MLHSIVPLQDLCGLLTHHLNFFIPKRNRPRKGAEGIRADIECQQFPKIHGNIAIKITIHHTGRKGRCCLSTPNNAVKFLPGIAKIISVKVNNGQYAVMIHHHVADVVVTVLIALGSAMQKMAVFRDILQERLATTFVFQLTVFIHSNLAVNLGVESSFPVRCVLRCRDGVDLRKNSSCIQTIAILLC